METKTTEVTPILSTDLGGLAYCENCGSIREHPVTGYCFDCGKDDWLCTSIGIRTTDTIDTHLRDGALKILLAEIGQIKVTRIRRAEVKKFWNTRLEVLGKEVIRHG